MKRISPMRIPKEFAISKYGAADGSQNIPETDDTLANAIQCQIVESCEHQVSEHKQQAAAAIQQCGRALEKQELTPVDLSINGPADDATHAFATLRSTTRDTLLGLRMAEQEMMRELRHFKIENRLYRSAAYMKSRILTVGILLLIITTESLINAKLFGVAHPWGWIGGWSTAIVTSVINVLPSFLAGIIILRHLHHVLIWKRLVASIGVFVFSGALIAYNLIVAHLRIALGNDPEHAFASALPLFLADPFNIVGSFDAVSLLLIGVFAGITAAIDGYSLFDDRYPGYGRITRAYEEKLRLYERRKHHFRKQIERVVFDQHREIDSRLKQLQKKVDGAAGALTKALTAISCSQDEATHVAFRCERLIRTYREANRQVRTTPPPGYFGTYPSLQTDLGVNLEKLQEKKRGMRHAVTEKMEEATTAKARIRELAQAEIASFGVLVDEVEAQAEQHINQGLVFGLPALGAAQ